MTTSQEQQGPRSVKTSTAPAAPSGQTPTPIVPSGRLDGLSYSQLKARQAELQSQRQDLATRRANVNTQYERAHDISKSGIADRLAVMDKAMVQIETDLAAVGQAMVLKRPLTNDPPRLPPTGWADDDVAGLGFGVFFTTVLFTVFVMRRIGFGKPNRVSATNAQALAPSNERLDRIEQAVDTIAVEIERVSENQRFMTRLMTETQLAGSIAAVRSATELAKSATESPPDGTKLAQVR